MVEWFARQWSYVRCHTNSVLSCDKMDSSLPCPATPARAHQTANHTEMPSIPSRLIFRKSTFIPSHTRTPFLYKTSCIVYKILSVLAAINVQTKSDINLGGQGMVITNQGVAIQPCFQQAKHMQFCKIGQQVMFIKNQDKSMHQRMGLNLPSSKPSGRSRSKHCPSGSGSWNWSSFAFSQYYSSTGSPSFSPWSTTHTNKHTIKIKK